MIQVVQLTSPVQPNAFGRCSSVMLGAFAPSDPWFARES